MTWTSPVCKTLLPAGGYRFTSNDIEHGVLRGNAPGPASLLVLLRLPRQWAGHTFAAGDPRAALAVHPVDPRIHFALNWWENKRGRQGNGMAGLLAAAPAAQVRMMLWSSAAL